MARFDPERAIDLSKPNPNGVFALIGDYGPYPSRPCDECGAEEYRGIDWGLGWACQPNMHKFGTDAEWAWWRGKYQP